MAQYEKSRFFRSNFTVPDSKFMQLLPILCNFNYINNSSFKFCLVYSTWLHHFSKNKFSCLNSTIYSATRLKTSRLCLRKAVPIKALFKV